MVSKKTFGTTSEAVNKKLHKTTPNSIAEWEMQDKKRRRKQNVTSVIADWNFS